MKKLLLIAGALFVALFATLSMAPAASAYPETTCNVTVDPVNAKPGDKVTVRCSLTTIDDGKGRFAKNARAAANADATWVVTFAGQTKKGTGENFTTNFTAPDVQDTTTYKVHAVAKDGSKVVCNRSVNVVVSPDSITEPPEGGLPGTGGPRLLLLIAGALLVVGGGAAIRRSRRNAA